MNQKIHLFGGVGASVAAVAVAATFLVPEKHDHDHAFSISVPMDEVIEPIEATVAEKLVDKAPKAVPVTYSQPIRQEKTVKVEKGITPNRHRSPTRTHRRFLKTLTVDLSHHRDRPFGGRHRAERHLGDFWR